jgi:hypothetical protein
MNRRRSSHPFAVATLLVLAAVVGAIGIGAIWANRQLFDTGTWVSTSGRMLGSADVRHRVAGFLAEELVSEAEAQLGAAGEDELEETVLPQLRARAPHLAERVLRTPRFRLVWLHANRIGHRALVRVLDEEGTRRRGGGAVVIDLTPALKELADDVAGGGLGAYVEPGAARIEVLEADELERAQDVVRAIRHLPLPAVLAFAALVALALLLGRARLPRTVCWIGLSLAAAGVLALLARALAGHEVVDALLSREPDREAAEAAWRIATSTIVDLAAGAIGLGALLALFGLLLGESGFAHGARRALAPLTRTALGRLWLTALAAVAFVALFVWAPIQALTTPLGIALFAAVIATGTFLLARAAANPPARERF